MRVMKTTVPRISPLKVLGVVCAGWFVVGAYFQAHSLAANTALATSSSLPEPLPEPLLSRVRSGADKNDFSVAKYESFGFFDDIPVREWDLLKARVEHVYPNVKGSVQALKRNKFVRAGDFYQEHYEPDFACRHERRIGQLGDGGKWVCDPHRLQAKPDCLVYSVGSEGDASFEMAVKKEIGAHCEIHTFDMGNYKAAVEKSGSHFHQWGIAANSTNNGISYTGPDKRQARGVFKTLRQTMDELNHTGRIIDLFKIDCEYCEWEVFPAFFEEGVHLNQILIELHAFGKPLPMPQSVNFFESMFNNGYVIFHKEVNIKYWSGEAIEFAFLKLRKDFFANMKNLVAKQTPAQIAAQERAHREAMMLANRQAAGRPRAMIRHP